MIKVKFDITSVFLFLFFLLFDSITYPFIILLSVLLLECAHLLAAKVLKVPVKCIKIGMFGARIELDWLCRSYKAELLIDLSGPLVNMMLGLSGIMALQMYWDSSVLFFVLTNLSLAIFNLMPIRSLDGGRILYSLLCIFFDVGTSESILVFVSFWLLVFLWGASVFLFFSSGADIYLALLSVYMFFRLIINREY